MRLFSRAVIKEYLQGISAAFADKKRTAISVGDHNWFNGAASQIAATSALW
jgi:hypothetical protein